MRSVKEEVRRYLRDNFLIGLETIELDDDTSFLEIGIIDSTGVLELVSFLEEAYGISIDDEEMLPENLDSLNNLERYVLRKSRVALASAS